MLVVGLFLFKSSNTASVRERGNVNGQVIGDDSFKTINLNSYPNGNISGH